MKKFAFHIVNVGFGGCSRSVKFIEASTGLEAMTIFKQKYVFASIEKVNEVK